MSRHEQSKPGEASKLMLATLSGPEPVNATLGGEEGKGSGVRRVPGTAAQGAATAPGYTLGRSLECTVALPSDPSVSRRHALLTCPGGMGEWYVEDLGSRSGTWLNGVRLPARAATPLRSGDLLRVGQWEFLLTVIGRGRVAGTGTRGASRTMGTIDDRRSSASRIERIDTAALAGGIAARRLALLTAAVEVLASARGEDALAREAVRAAVEGSGGAGGRGALVRPGGADAGLEVIASVGMGTGDELSRSLVAEAMGGQLAKLSGEASPAALGASIAELGISGALAAPVRVGDRVVACLYVDVRGAGATIGDEAAGFVDAVSKVLGLSLAEMHRRDLEQRQLVMQAELEAAHQVQQFLLPRGVLKRGGYEVAHAVLPGRLVAGDMVEVVELPGERFAVAVGDATGHGVGPAMLIATVQSQLAALLSAGMEPAEVVTRINRALCPRVDGGRFVSLWLGVFSPDGAVEVIDAGHGHAMVCGGERGTCALRAIGGIPLGIDEDFRYTSDRVHVPAGGRVVLYSDGVVEERTDEGRGEPFGVAGLVAAIGSGSAQETVAAVTAALLAAAGAGLSDDATVAVVARRA
ncbi:MAG TPA: SpoIIE family protein phosphatase [Phycisphaerales bacterium]|nr:SpoIIE family protein phosphatase [Phycisphaerales bacterium]